MAEKFLFGKWRFVGRLMRKKGLLLAVVLVLQAALLSSQGIVVGLTKVKDSVNGRATARLEGNVSRFHFRPDNASLLAMLDGVARAELVLAPRDLSESLSLPVEVAQVGGEGVILHSAETPAPERDAWLTKGGTEGFEAQLVFRKRSLLSAMLHDRGASAGRGREGWLSGFFN